jgi:hypothetical protein
MKKKVPFFSALGEKQTYLNIVYVLVAFPLSVAYFSLVITGLSLSLGLLILVAGFFIFAGTLIMIQGFRWLDIQLSRVFLGLDIQMEKRDRTESGLKAFLKQLFGSSSTWKGFVYYLLVKFPLDTIVWSISIAFLAITLDLLLAPALVRFWWFVDDNDINRWLLEFFDDVYILPFLGIIWGMISLHVVRGLAWISGSINEAFLGD